jgi:hypothetical protein
MRDSLSHTSRHERNVESQPNSMAGFASDLLMISSHSSDRCAVDCPTARPVVGVPLALPVFSLVRLCVPSATPPRPGLDRAPYVAP